MQFETEVTSNKTRRHTCTKCHTCRCNWQSKSASLLQHF